METKHGNLYNDLANVQKSCFWELFFYVDRSLYKFPCFVFLVILEKRPCNVIIHSCLILCKTIKNWQNEKFLPTHEKNPPRQLLWFGFWGNEQYNIENFGVLMSPLSILIFFFFFFLGPFGIPLGRLAYLIKNSPKLL